MNHPPHVAVDPDASFPLADTFHGYVLRAEDVAVGGLVCPEGLTHGVWAHRGVFRGRDVLIKVRDASTPHLQSPPPLARIVQDGV